MALLQESRIFTVLLMTLSFMLIQGGDREYFILFNALWMFFMFLLQFFEKYSSSFIKSVSVPDVYRINQCKATFLTTFSSIQKL